MISNCKFQISNSEKGVTLIITFFIMVIVLAVVLGISVILYSEIIVVRNMGNSVISFYSADSGIEKVLYYDRMIKPEGAARGLCSICSTCGTGNSEKSMDCESCGAAGSAGCAPDTCDNCIITFNTFPAPGSPDYFDYSIRAEISMDGLSPRLEINSTGSFINVSRAINVFISDATVPALPPPSCPSPGIRDTSNGHDYCWYLGSPDQSCDGTSGVCADNGRTPLSVDCTEIDSSCAISPQFIESVCSQCSTGSVAGFNPANNHCYSGGTNGCAWKNINRRRICACY